jgi:lipopolysaccharide transport system permease protein
MMIPSSQRATLEARPPAGAEPSEDAYPASQEVSLLEPAHRRFGFRDLIGSGDVIYVVARRDFKARFKQSLLGPLWLVVQPAAMLVALFVAFDRVGNVSTGGIPYGIFALVGLTVWSYFQAGLNMGLLSVVSNSQYVKRTACPRIAFPVGSLIAALPNLAITLVASLAVTAVFGYLSPRVLLLPAAIAWLFLCAVAMITLLSALAVRYRDLQSLVPFILQVGVFVTPIGYSLASVSDPLAVVLSLNPFTGIIEAWRWMILGVNNVNELAIGLAAGITVALLIVAWRVFTRLEVLMADEI